MNRAGPLWLAPALALIATPALAKSPTCDMIEAFARDGDASLAGIAATTDRDGLVNVSYRGKATGLARASGCEMSGPTHIFEISCKWETRGDIKAAKGAHARLLAELNQCLGTPLVKRDYKSSVEGLEVLDPMSGEIESEEGTSVYINLQIYHHMNIDGSYAVVLSISR